MELQRSLTNYNYPALGQEREPASPGEAEQQLPQPPGAGAAQQGGEKERPASISDLLGELERLREAGQASPEEIQKISRDTMELLREGKLTPEEASRILRELEQFSERLPSAERLEPGQRGEMPSLKLPSVEPPASALHNTPGLGIGADVSPSPPSLPGPGPGSNALAVLAAVAAILAFALLLARARSLGGRGARARAGKGRSLLQRLLGRGSGDLGAREAIIALYEILLEKYGRVVRPKRASETHREYGRVVPEDERGLYYTAARIYEEAKFSDHPLGEAHVETMKKIVDAIPRPREEGKAAKRGGGR